MMQEANLVWKLLNDGGHIYVCGDVDMSSGVKDAVKQILKSKGLGEDEAGKYIDNLVRSKRYLTDVFAPVSKRSKSSQE